MGLALTLLFYMCHQFNIVFPEGTQLRAQKQWLPPIRLTLLNVTMWINVSRMALHERKANTAKAAKRATDQRKVDEEAS